MKNRIVSMAFSKVNYPLLAVGDDFGNIVIWDMNEKKIFSLIKEAHTNEISYLEF